MVFSCSSCWYDSSLDCKKEMIILIFRPEQSLEQMPKCPSCSVFIAKLDYKLSKWLLLCSNCIIQTSWSLVFFIISPRNMTLEFRFQFFTLFRTLLAQARFINWNMCNLAHAHQWIANTIWEMEELVSTLIWDPPYLATLNTYQRASCQETTLQWLPLYQHPAQWMLMS